MIDRKIFYDQVRKSIFGGRITTAQVDGMDVLLSVWGKNYQDQISLAQLAYCLATAFHETARTMQPIAEYGKGKGRTYGTPDPKTGKTYYGRGFVQLTWLANYKTMGDLLNVDLVHNPDRAMEPVLAANILFHGMLAGLFTGKRLSHYINSVTSDFVGARRIVNGADRAQMIAGYAVDFATALEASLRVAGPPLPPAPVIPTTPPDVPLFPPQNKPPGLFSRFVAALVARLVNRG